MSKIIIKSKKSRIITIIAIILFAVIGGLLVFRTFAATTSIELVSSKASVKEGDTLDVDVIVRSGGESVTFAAAQLTFDPSILNYVSTNYSSTTLSDGPGPDDAQGDNFVKVSGFPKSALQPDSQFTPGDVTIARVSFKVLATSGKAIIGIDKANSSVNTRESYTPGALTTPNSLTSVIGVAIPIGSQQATDVPAQVVLSVSPSSVRKDQTFDVAVAIDSHSNPVVAASVRLTFDSAKINYVSTAYDGVSSFASTGPEEGNGSDYVTLSRYSFGDKELPTNNIVLGKVTFKAVADSANVSITTDLTKSYVGSGTTAENVLNESNSVTLIIAPPEVDPPNNPDPVNPDPEVPTTPDPNPNPGAGGGSTAPPTAGPTQPKPVTQGTPVKTTVPVKTSDGKPVKKNDYYLNNNYVGSNNPGESEFSLETNNLNPGEYELTTRSTADDGTTEESSKKFTVLSASFLRRMGVPVLVILAVSLTVGSVIVFGLVYKKAVPFYKTINQFFCRSFKSLII